ncbi:Uncharacterised protein [Candidatus Ornithobacterium hominis]|uniref:hypothetical protein n=1 Tax=Candidatus Ornithobacterium hominis TaxID=2497989 RepID=UPI000E5A5B8F|nr:hypothetical protein [Candidatus Ornithobacterium hominis]SZD72019.1 Uncharacterised protein [Candidatus Ornithobacterium hominis]
METGINIITTILIFPFLNLITNFANQKAQGHNGEKLESHKTNLGIMRALYYRELIQNYEIIGDHIFKANQALKQ